MAIQKIKEGIYDAYLEQMNPKWRDRQQAAIQSFIELYKTNRQDVLSVIKNESLLKEKIYPFGSVFLTSPLSF